MNESSVSRTAHPKLKIQCYRMINLSYLTQTLLIPPNQIQSATQKSA